MRKHLRIGKIGEHLAAEWLRQKGDQILYRNWRYSHYEIDIISLRNDILCFVEVKTRSSLKYGMPDEAVTPEKIRRMMEAGEAFLDSHPVYERVQYDLLSIILADNGENEYLLFEDLSL